jgi:hypothetical protein
MGFPLAEPAALAGRAGRAAADVNSLSNSTLFGVQRP